MKRSDFGKDFKWGVSTSACQIEGGYLTDGKGMSIWDSFSRKKNKIFKNHRPDTACNFYHNYGYDIWLLKQLNIPNFRLSVSWPRILPNGTGTINHKGLDFYKRVIDYCLHLNIEPWLTLYHWDLPQKLEEKGGWTNRNIIDWFLEFTAICVKNFGDRVNYWMVMNEPIVFTGAGYFSEFMPLAEKD